MSISIGIYKFYEHCARTSIAYACKAHSSDACARYNPIGTLQTPRSKRGRTWKELDSRNCVHRSRLYEASPRKRCHWRLMTVITVQADKNVWSSADIVLRIAVFLLSWALTKIKTEKINILLFSRKLVLFLRYKNDD